MKQKGTEKLYALKVLNKKEMIEKDHVRHVYTERQILSLLDHPYIVTLYYSFTDKEADVSDVYPCVCIYICVCVCVCVCILCVFYVH